MSIASVPATFNIRNGLAGTVTFTIPAGVYVSGVWEWDGTCTAGHTDSIFPPTGGGSFPPQSSGAFTETLACSVADLTDINAAAGGAAMNVDVFTTVSPPFVNVSAFTLTLVASGPPPPPPPIRPVGLRRSVVVVRQPTFFRRPVPSVPPGPTLDATSITGYIAVEEPIAGDVTITLNATSATVTIGVSGDNGSVSNGGNLSASSATGEIAVTDDGHAGDMASTPPPVTKQGALKFAWCRDNRGAAWTTEVTVAAACDLMAAGGAWLGNRMGVLYTVTAGSPAVSQVYWKWTPNPDDWTIHGPATVGGVTGQVRGLACNQMGNLCALVGNTPVTSHDGGLTWTVRAAVSAAGNTGIVAFNHYFVIVAAQGKVVTHYVSKDGGETFR